MGEIDKLRIVMILMIVLVVLFGGGDGKRSDHRYCSSLQKTSSPPSPLKSVSFASNGRFFKGEGGNKLNVSGLAWL